MKHLLLATAIATGLASTSIAGAIDVIIAAEPVVVAPAPQITDWSGPYAGIVAAFGGGTYDQHMFDGEEDYGDSYDLDGDMYGAFAGYNIQRGSFVYGLEAAYLAGSIGYEDTFRITSGAEFTSFMDLKARAGFAAGNALIYGFAGGTASKLHVYDSKRDESFTPMGWNYGAGIDLLVTDSIFLGVEYIIRDFSDDLEAFEGWTMDATVKAVQLRVGMNF